MELKDYLDVLYRRKWIVAGTVALAVAATLLFTFLQAPLYRSGVKILAEINKAGESASDSLISFAFGDPNEYIRTQAEIITTKTMARAVHDRLEYQYEEARYQAEEGEQVFIPSSLPAPEELMEAVKVERLQNTNVFEIAVTDGDPRLARDIAQAYAEEYLLDRRLSAVKQISDAREEVWNRIQELETQLEELSQEINQYARENIPPELEAEASQAVSLWATLYEKYMSLRIAEALEQRGLEIIEPAEEGEKVSPRPARNGILALFLGLVLGIGLAFLVDYLDNRLKTREDFERYYGVPIIGEIAKADMDEEQERKVIYFEKPDHPAAEGFRTLRTNLQFLGLEKKVKSIQVTSSFPEEGKTSVAMNLGAALSEMGRSVIVVEADLRRAALNEFFPHKPEKGLTGVLSGTLKPAEAVTSTRNPNLVVMTSGIKPPNPAEMVSSGAMQDTLHRLEEEYDYVIVDAPPVLAVSDAVAMAPMVDGVLLVASYGVAEREGARRTVELLEKVGARILGVVINNLEIKGRYGYGYYRPYHYHYYQAEGEKEHRGGSSG